MRPSRRSCSPVGFADCSKDRTRRPLDLRCLPGRVGFGVGRWLGADDDHRIRSPPAPPQHNAVTVDGTRTYTKNNVTLNSMYDWRLP